MNISIVGTGRMGQALVRTLSQAYPKIIWASRSKAHAEHLVAELSVSGVSPATHEEALDADIIIGAMWYRDLLPWVEQHRDRLRGKIFVDICNPFNETFDDFTLEPHTSAAEELQKLIPDTAVVGAFKNSFWEVFAQPLHRDRHSDVFVTADDETAKQIICDLLEPLPFRIFDAGPLKNNRTIERMTLFSRELSKRYGHYPYVSWSLWGHERN